MKRIKSEADKCKTNIRKKLPDFREVRGFLRFTPQRLDAWCNRHGLFPEPERRKKVMEFFLRESREPLLFELITLDGFRKLDCAGETERIGRLMLLSDNPQAYAALDLYHQLRAEAGDGRPMCLEDVRTVYTRCYQKRAADNRKKIVEQRSDKKYVEEETEPSFVINAFNSLSISHGVPLGYHIEKNKPKKALQTLVLLTPKEGSSVSENAPFSMMNELNTFASSAVCERGLLKAITEIAAGCKIIDPADWIYDTLLTGNRATVVTALVRGGLPKLKGVIDKYGYDGVELGKVLKTPAIIIEREGLRVFDIDVPLLLGYTMFDYAAMRDVTGLPEFAGNRRLTRRAVISAYADSRVVEKDTDIGNVGKMIYLPYGGRYRLTPTQVFGTLSADGRAFLTSAHSYEGDIQSPFLEGVYSVVVSLNKLVAAGVAPNFIRVDCNLPYVDAGKDKGKEFLYRLGILYARSAIYAGVFANDLNEPGNNIKNVIAGGVAPPQRLITNVYRGGTKVFRLPIKRDEYGMPDFKYLKKLLTAVSINIGSGNITAASVAERNALAEIIKSCLGEGCGFSLANADLGILRPSFGDIIVCIEDINELTGIESEYLGITDSSGVIKGAEVEVRLSELQKGYHEHAHSRCSAGEEASKGPPRHIYGGPKNYSPIIFLPVFDKSAGLLEKGFIDCGGRVDTHLMATREREFFIEVRRRIEKADILVFSAAPNQHTDIKRTITEFCSQPIVMDAIHELLYRREGLILALGEAFYSLVELGFLPYGRYVENTAQSFAVLKNADAPSVGRIARAKLTSDYSPWLSSCSAGALYAAVALGGGRTLKVEDNALATLMQGGQICSRYVDPQGAPALQYPHNPQGNTAAIESLCSPDGRIYGAVGHNYKVANVINAGENNDLQLFKNGVRYFR